MLSHKHTLKLVIFDKHKIEITSSYKRLEFLIPKEILFMRVKRTCSCLIKQLVFFPCDKMV